jgi:hypothetical protein
VKELCVLCVSNVSCSPGEAHLADYLVLLAAVVLLAPASHAVTKLLVSCLSPWLDLILTWPCCESAVGCLVLYPVIYLIRYYT